jgi:septum site-determining protein MinD
VTRGVVFAVAGAKGGVGKTTTSINLSAVLAGFGHDVVLVELDIAMANVADFLNLGVRLEHGRDPTLHDVLAGTASVAEATYEAPGGFDVVPSGTTLRGFSNANIGATDDVVSAVRAEYDVVILDTGAGLGMETILPLSLADETILVSSPRVASVRDTKKTRNLVHHTDGTVAGVVFVKSGSGRSPGVERIAEFLEVGLLGHVPEDSAVANAQDAGQPVVVAAADSPAAKAYGALGSRIHDRIGTIRAALVTTEREAADADVGDDADSAALETGDESDADGFAFVGDSDGTSSDSDAAATAADGDGSAAPAEGQASQGRSRAERREATPSTPEAPEPNQAEGSESISTTRADGAHQRRTGRGEGGRETRGRQTGVPSAPRQASDRVDSEQNESQEEATDDEIAEQLASVETADSGGDTRGSDVGADSSGDVAGSGEGADTSTPGQEPAADGSASATDDSWETKQSTAKQFIDRAIGLIDRGK